MSTEQNNHLRSTTNKGRTGLVLSHMIKHKAMPSLEARDEDLAFEQAVALFQVCSYSPLFFRLIVTLYS